MSDYIEILQSVIPNDGQVVSYYAHGHHDAATLLPALGFHYGVTAEADSIRQVWWLLGPDPDEPECEVFHEVPSGTPGAFAATVVDEEETTGIPGWHPMLTKDDPFLNALGLQPPAQPPKLPQQTLTEAIQGIREVYDLQPEDDAVLAQLLDIITVLEHDGLDCVESAQGGGLSVCIGSLAYGADGRFGAFTSAAAMMRKAAASSPALRQMSIDELAAKQKGATP